MKREAYLSALHQETQEAGKEPVYLDETGFSETAFRESAYAPQGICVEDKVPSNRYASTTLIAAGFEAGFRGSVLFEGNRCDAIAFNTWNPQRCCVLCSTTSTL